MKKWLSIYIAICAVLLCVCGCVGGMAAARQADFGAVQQAEGYTSQVILTKEHSYVLYQNPQQKKYQIVKTDKKETEYESLATAHRNGVYQLYRYAAGGKQLYGAEPLGAAQGEEPWQPVTFAQTGELLAFGSNEKGLLCGILQTDGKTVVEYFLPLDNPTEWKEQQSYLLPEEHFPLAAAYENGSLWLGLEDGSVYAKKEILQKQEESFAQSPLADSLTKQIADGGAGTWRLYQIRAEVLRLILPILLLVAAVLLLIYGNKKQNHIVFRLLCCTEILCCGALLFTGVLFSERIVKQGAMENGREAGYILETVKAKQRADETVSPTDYWTVMQERSGLLEDLAIVEPKTGRVLLAKTMPAGTDINRYYGDEMDELTAQVAAGNETVMTQLKNNGQEAYVVAMRDWTDVNAKSVLLAVLSERGILRSVEGQRAFLWHSILALLGLLTAVHLLLFYIFAGRWQRLVKGISYVATEQMPYTDIPKKNDGLQRAWVPLERIGQNLSRLYYESEKLYRSYYRFVPKDMEQLLKKSELSDFKIGDRTKVQGCMVHFVLEDLKNFSGEDYMQLITESMREMHRIRKQKNGIYLSGTADLLERKLFFEKNPDQALRFAIELQQAYAGNALLAEKNLIMMLHAGEFQYGISGVQDMTTPYMFSAQERVLEPYVKPLAEAKVKLALTEQTVRLIGHDFSLRYIGFLSDREKCSSLKLYECLDAYDEQRRKQMLEADVLFQKGLQLFYSNDFYLARNTFNEVLKLNEEDQIARWYLFRCEYYLNRADAEVFYGLFEDIVFEQEYER